MPKSPSDFIGRTFHRLTVTNTAPRRKGHNYWACVCSCGKERIIAETSLKRGYTKSCGCLRNERVRAVRVSHDLSSSPEYFVWRAMLTRCENPKYRYFHDYGGRGITVCERWHSFGNFIGDMGRRPSDKYSIERIDNDLGYSPENCKWILRVRQNDNRRRSRYLTLNGETHLLTEWSRQTGISHPTLIYRLKAGWSVERALTTRTNRPNS